MKKRLFFVGAVILIILGAGCQKVAIQPLADQAEEARVNETQKTKPIIIYVDDVMDIPEDWLTYTNDEYQFEFKYPKEVEWGEQEQGVLLNMTFMPAVKVEGGVSAVNRRMLQLSISDAKRGTQCISGEDDIWISKDPVKLGDNVFCLSRRDEAAAGTTYHEYNYSISLDDVDLSFNFVIPEANCGNYDVDAGCVAMDEVKETELFKQIAATYKNLNSNSESLLVMNSVNVTDRKITKGNDNYSIEITYPYFNMDQEKYGKLNYKIMTFVNEQAFGFESDAEKIVSGHEPGKWFLTYNYKITAIGDDFVSVLFEGDLYTGGAHPLPLYETLIFDLDENDEDELIDIFAKDFDYLQFLSDESKKKFSNTIDFSDADWIADGILPIENNFGLYYIEGDRLVIIFPPYQVAPYAAGAQMVSFLVDELQDNLSSEWLKRLTQN